MFRLSRLGVAAVAAAVFAGPVARAAEIDKLIPADADSVISVNVQQIIGSELVKKYALEQIKQALKGKDAQQTFGALGLDPLKDIERVTAGTSGTDPNDMKLLVIARGKFDADKLYAAAEAESKKDDEKVKVMKDGNLTLVKLQGKDQPNPMYATVIDPKTLVVGSTKDMVKDAVAVAGGAKTAAAKRELADLVTRMDEKASLYLVSLVSGKLDNLPLPVQDPSVKKNLGKMENVTMTLKVAADVGLEVTMGMKDEEAADEFSKLVDQGIQQAKGLLPLVAAQNPQLKPLVELSKTLKSGTKKKDVEITANLTGDAIGKMLQGGGD